MRLLCLIATLLSLASYGHGLPCRRGEVWLEKKVKKQCAKEGIKAVSCVPSGKLGDLELADGQRWSNGAFLFQCTKTGPSSLSLRVEGCVLPGGSALYMGSKIGIPNKGLYTCVLNKDRSLIRRFQPGCFFENRLYLANQSWVSGATELTCIIKGASFEVHALGCIIGKQTIPLGSYVAHDNSHFKCQSSSTSAWKAALVNVPESEYDLWFIANAISKINPTKPQTSHSTTPIFPAPHPNKIAVVTTTPKPPGKVQPAASHAQQQGPQQIQIPGPDQKRPVHPKGASVPAAPAVAPPIAQPAPVNHGARGHDTPPSPPATTLANKAHGSLIPGQVHGTQPTRNNDHAHPLKPSISTSGSSHDITGSSTGTNSISGSSSISNTSTTASTSASTSTTTNTSAPTETTTSVLSSDHQNGPAVDDDKSKLPYDHSHYHSDHDATPSNESLIDHQTGAAANEASITTTPAPMTPTTPESPIPTNSTQQPYQIPAVDNSSQAQEQCCLLNLAVLYRLYSPKTGDYLYTISSIEADRAVKTLGYERQASPGQVATSRTDCNCKKSAFMPIFRLFASDTHVDHLYTHDPNEASEANATRDYKPEGVAYFCPETAGQCGASEGLSRYLRGANHFYTTDVNEGNETTISQGGQFEGITCYIWPAWTKENSCSESPNSITEQPATTTPPTLLTEPEAPPVTAPAPAQEPLPASVEPMDVSSALAQAPESSAPLPPKDPTTILVDTTLAESPVGQQTNQSDPSPPIPIISSQPEAHLLLDPSPVIVTIPKHSSCCQINLVPLYRLFSQSSGDHFYTTSLQEALRVTTAELGNYTFEGSAGRVAVVASDCNCSQSGFIPVHRLFKSGETTDHFYTTDAEEANMASAVADYKHEGIAFYCAADADHCGASQALKRYRLGNDHFYTTDESEAKTKVLAHDGKFEGITCYIWRELID